MFIKKGLSAPCRVICMASVSENLPAISATQMQCYALNYKKMLLDFCNTIPEIL